MQDEIQHILQGKSPVKHGGFIQTIISYLAASHSTSKLAKEHKHFKKEETTQLRKFIDANNYWVAHIDSANYLSEGAEQKVYLKDGTSVFKLNDAIYYTSWLDYFYNLLLNNYFFSDTAYNLIGFYEQEQVLYAVVQQPFIKANLPTNLALVKEFMASNGFENIRNNDYYNSKLGIILEDLHDENVLTKNEMLFFIDTVFYIKKE